MSANLQGNGAIELAWKQPGAEPGFEEPLSNKLTPEQLEKVMAQGAAWKEARISALRSAFSQPHTRAGRFEAALTLARAGIPVFPTRAGEKEPLAGSKGFKDATTDEFQCELWWNGSSPGYGGYDDNHNVAFVPDSAGLCVIDVDGEEGKATWAAWCEKHGDLGTFTVNTPSGGMHVYFCGELPPTARKLGPGIDTRGRRSYVLVPPSVFEGNNYTLASDKEPIILPEWLEAMVPTTERERRIASGEFVEGDSPELRSAIRDTVLREVKWHGEPFIGGGSDERCYKLMAKLREINVKSVVASDETILEAMQELWQPGFDPEWYQLKLENCEKFAQNERGSVNVQTPLEQHAKLMEFIRAADAAAGNAPGSDKTAAPPPPAFEGFLTVGPKLRDRVFPTKTWVWRHRLLAGSPNLYTGANGIGKTTLAENLAVCVSTGIDFLGHPTTQMQVVLLVAEDPSGPVRNNIWAIAEKFDVVEQMEREGKLHFLSVISDPYEQGNHLASVDDQGVVEYLPLLKEVVVPRIAVCRGPTLFIVDPLASFVTVNRNDPIPARAVTEHLFAPLCQLNGGQTTVLVNDHPSVTAMKDGRHIGGDQQFAGAFHFTATLRLPAGKHKETDELPIGPQQLVFETMKPRYAGKTVTKLYRDGDCPAFLLDAADRPGPTAGIDEKRVDRMRKAAIWVRDRLARKERCGFQSEWLTRPDNKGEGGPRSMSLDLKWGHDDSDAKIALADCVEAGWLTVAPAIRVGGKQKELGKVSLPAHYEPTAEMPADPMMTYPTKGDPAVVMVY
jgi:hypothetical protein